MMFRPAVLLGLAGRLDLSGLLILAGTSWQLMQHVAYIHHKCGIFKFQILNFEFQILNFHISDVGLLVLAGLHGA